VGHILARGVLPSSYQDAREDHLAGLVEDLPCLLHLVHSTLVVDTAHDQDTRGIAQLVLQVLLVVARMVQDHRALVHHSLVSDLGSQGNHVHRVAHLGQEEGAHGPCTCEEEDPCWAGSGTLGVHRGREMPLNYSLRLAHCLLKLHLQVVEALKHYLPLIGQWPETWTVNWRIQLETGMVLVLEREMA